MFIKVSDLGFDFSDKIKNAIFPNGLLVDGDFVSLLVPLFSDPSLGAEIATVISKINQLKEEAKDAEIEALKAKTKSSKAKVTGRGSKTFWADISSDIENILSGIIDTEFIKTLDWVNTPQFSLESKILSQDNLAYITQSTTGENPFQGLTKKKGGGYSGTCNKINREILTKMLVDHVDYQIMAYHHGYSILYLLHLILEELFTVDTWSHQVTYKIDQKLVKENIASEEDWQWLHGGKEDTLYEKERSLSWGIDKPALEKVLSDMKNITEHKLPDGGVDLESLSYLRKLILDNLVLNSSTLSKLVKHEGKKASVMLGDTSIETETKAKPSKRSKITA